SRRWLRLEVALDPRRAREVVALRVDPRVIRDQEQVPGRERHAGASHMRATRPGAGELIRGRELADPDEVGLFEEPVLRARRGLPQRDGARLLPQRCARIDLPPAVEPGLAADPLRAVQLIAAAFVVERPGDAELPVE